MSSLSFHEKAGSPGWWLTEMNRDPIGPMSTDLLVEWVRVGLVVPEALVCEVGGDEWRSIGDVAPFGDALQNPRRRFDASRERCIIDMPSLPPEPDLAPAPREWLDSSSEVTVVAVPRPRLLLVTLAVCLLADCNAS